MKYILALDQGTTSSRAIIFDENASVVATAQKELTQHFPQSGWVEHDPNEIWSSQHLVAQEALAKAGLSPKSITAIGIANQRETTIVWDRITGEAIHPAIVWQDRRTATICEQLKNDGYADLIRSSTGLIIDAYFSGTKVAWILDQVPGARLRAKRGELAFGTVESWLTWNLTGGTSSAGAVHVTDISNASRTMLFDVRSNQWSEALCALLKVPMAVLPTVVASSSVAGYTDVLGGSIPIAGLAGDQQSALFGQACIAPGMAKNTYGTGCFMLAHCGDKLASPPAGLLLTSACQLQGQAPQYAIEGSVFMGGAIVQWLRDGLGIIAGASQIESLAMSVRDTGGAMFVPAFTGLGAPYWDPQARGALLGLSRGTSNAHIARAALESIALQSSDLLQAMSDGGRAMHSLRVDGGAATNNLLMQMQADISGVEVVRPKVLETTALGAAYLAGLATGVWNNTDELSKHWQIDRVFTSQISDDERQSKLMLWRKAVVASRQFAA